MARPKSFYQILEILPNYFPNYLQHLGPFRGPVLVLWRISDSVSAMQGSLQMFTSCIRVHGFPPFPALEEPLMPHRAGWPEPAWLGLEFSSLGIGRPDRPGTRDAEAGSLNLERNLGVFPESGKIRRLGNLEKDLEKLPHFAPACKIYYV